MTEFEVFAEKVAALAPGLLEQSRLKLMRTRLPSAPKAPMPGTFGVATKLAVVHPSMQEDFERMTPASWKQTAKDLGVSAIAGGVGYGIGRTLGEVIGEQLAKTGPKPHLRQGVGVATGLASMLGAYYASRGQREMKNRREAANKGLAPRKDP